MAAPLEPLGNGLPATSSSEALHELDLEVPEKATQNAFRGIIEATFPHCQDPIDPKFCSKCKPIVKYLCRALEPSKAFTIKEALAKRVLRRKDVKFRHHQSLQQLAKSRKDGCFFCEQLVLSAGGFFHTKKRYWHPLVALFISSGVVTLDPLHRHPAGIFWLPALTGEDLKSKSGYIGGRVFYVYARPAAYQINLYSYDQNPGSTADGLPLCREWLQRCKISHKECQHHAQSIPARLICVGKEDIKLVLADEVTHPDFAEYATLSHCWGKNPIFKLTSENLADCRNDIPIKNLPKTFRDAIRITRTLELEYLWIDSLCIIQDSKEDWENELVLMGQIYRDAVINIAATSASDGRAGCFFERAPGWRHQLLVRKKGTPISSYDIVPQNFDKADVNTLLGRGWVAQERLLSRRTLHFTSRQIFWECDEEPACEYFPTGYPETDYRPPHLPTDFRWKKKSLLEHESWDRVVQMYSRGKLTKLSDKLPAIGGIARLNHDRSGGHDYLAGLWMDEFETNLLWYVERRQGQRIKPYTAPTWSWASNEGQIHYPSDLRLNQRLHAFLVPKVHSLPLNHFGSLQSPLSIRLRCHALLANFVENDLLDGKQIWVRIRVGSQNYSVQIIPDLHPFPEQYKTQCGQHVWFLVVQSDWKYRGLLLSRTGGSRGEYQRLGWWCLLPKPDEDSVSYTESELDAESEIDENHSLSLEPLKEFNAVEQRDETCFAETKDVDGEYQCFIDLI